MKAREAARLGALRLLLAAVKQREVDERITLDDAGVVAVVEKMIKQRRDSIAQFEKAARQDLADKEKFEVAILEAYLPQRLSDAEVEAIVAEAVAATGAQSPADMGKVMGAGEAEARGARRHGPGLRARQGEARGTIIPHDPAGLHPVAARARRHRRRGGPLREAQEGGRQFHRLLPVPQRKDAVVHREPLQAVLPLLRLRRPRQRHRLPHGVLGPGLPGGDPRASPKPSACRAGERAAGAGRAPQAAPGLADAHDGRALVLPRRAQEIEARDRLPQGARALRRDRGALRAGLRSRRMAEPGIGVHGLCHAPLSRTPGS